MNINKVIKFIILAGILVAGFFILFNFKKSESLAGIPSVSEFKKLSYDKQTEVIKNYADKSPAQVWDYLKSAFLVDGQVVGNAHELAHIVGNGMYAKYGLEGITKCDTTFAYGCMHGVTQKLLAARGVGAVKEVQAECTKIFPPDKSQNYTGCIHGMGHGLLSWEKYNVPKALEDCDILDSLYQNYCYDGVFMENISEFPHTVDSDQKIWEFCKDMNQKYQFNCARYQSQIFLAKYPGNIAKVGMACDTAGVDILKKTCLESLGYFISQTNKGVLDPILKQCGMLKTADKYRCEIGSAREVIFQAYTDWSKTSTGICNQLPASWKEECLASNAQVNRLYNNQ